MADPFEARLREASYGEQFKAAIYEFTTELSPSLKQMKADLLNSYVENCYKDEHIDDAFTNVE